MSAELNRKKRELSQAYSYLQSLLPHPPQKLENEKGITEGRVILPPDFDSQDFTTRRVREDDKTSQKAWEVRRAVFRSGLCQITIETFGGFHLYRGLTAMEEAEWDGYLPKLLLKAIIAHGSHRVPKDQLIEALWPEVAPNSGERNFKITLYRLRKSLEPEMDKAFGSSYLYLRSGLVYLDEELCKSDLDDFLSLHRQGEKNERGGNIESALLLYNNAIDLYKGDFLSEELYTSWIDAKREELRKLYINLLYKIADIQEKRGTSKIAIDCYKKIIQIDPLAEHVYRKLMTLYSSRRMQTEAIKLYKDCCKALQDGLDAEPETLTTSIYRKIKEVR
jgi:DNA-binding SARP family transcriptional activator